MNRKETDALLYLIFAGLKQAEKTIEEGDTYLTVAQLDVVIEDLIELRSLLEDPHGKKH